MVKVGRKLPKIEHGGIAQLGERLNGIQEVSGSIPLISTKIDHKAKALWSVLYKRKMRNRIPGQGPKRVSVEVRLGFLLSSILASNYILLNKSLGIHITG